MAKQQRQELVLYLMAWAVVLAWGSLTSHTLQLVLLVVAVLCSIRVRSLPVSDGRCGPPPPPVSAMPAAVPSASHHSGGSSSSSVIKLSAALHGRSASLQWP